MVYAVIDTNIFVSSFITKNVTAATRKVVNSLFNGLIVPLYNEDIIAEYSDVLHRHKFHLAENWMSQKLHHYSTLSNNTA